MKFFCKTSEAMTFKRFINTFDNMFDTCTMSVSADGLSFHQTDRDVVAPTFGQGEVTIRVLLRADGFEHFVHTEDLTFSFNTSQMCEALKPLRRKRDFLSVMIEDLEMMIETLGEHTKVVDLLELRDPTCCLKIEETFDVLPHVVRSSLFHKICKIESDLSDLLTLRKIGGGRISITSQIEGVASLSAELGCGEDSELVTLVEQSAVKPYTDDELGVELSAHQLIGLSETAGALTDKLYIHFGEFGGVMLRSHVGTLGEMLAQLR